MPSCSSASGRNLLPSRGPYGLLFHDAGNFKRAPDDYGDLVVSLLEPGGFLVLDDMTPVPGADPIREWVLGHTCLRATEVLTTPKTSALVSARL
jgi:hypothetical protein